MAFNKYTKIFNILLFLCIYSQNTAVFAASIDLSLQFYLNQVRLWEQEGQQAKLQSSVLAGLKKYCYNPANFATCGINSTSDVSFTESAVVISPGYPVNYKSRHLEVRISIQYNVGSTLVRLPGEVVARIVYNERESVSTSVGYYLIYIDRAFFSIPPPHLANKVIVPIFVLGTLALIIVALALRNHQMHQERRRLGAAGREMKPRGKSAASNNAHSTRDNKVAASANNLDNSADSEQPAKGKRQPDIEALDREQEDSGKQLQQQRPKKKSKTKSKSKSKSKPGKLPATTGAAIDWSGGGDGGNNGSVEAKTNGNGEFSNVGFEKSLNEGDPRARQSGVSRQSASNLSEIIQVRSGAASPMKAPIKKQQLKAAGKSKWTAGDAEEDMLMDNTVFKPPEANLDDGDRGGDGGGVSFSEDDVPTLRNSSDQQML